MLTQARAAIAAASRTAAPPVSVRRKPRTGASRLRVHAIPRGARPPRTAESVIVRSSLLGGGYNPDQVLADLGVRTWVSTRKRPPSSGGPGTEIPMRFLRRVPIDAGGGLMRTSTAP